MKTYLLIILGLFYACADVFAGEYPKVLTAYLGATPTLDGFISDGEYADAEFLKGVNGWCSDTKKASKDTLDLSTKIWYKHDGTYLYFAFDVTDNKIYGFDTERWVPDANTNANDLTMKVGWPFFGDGIEIMMNPTYKWDNTQMAAGDGMGWQIICSTHKSTFGGLEYGGLIEGVPFSKYAWTNYKEWYVKEHMKATVRIKSEEEGHGYVVEWRISPNPCMQIDSSHFIDLTKENKVGINIEFQDLDEKDDGRGKGNLASYRHVDYLAKVGNFNKSIFKSFATLLISPATKNDDAKDLIKE